MKRRRELYASQPPEAIKESRDSEDRGECLDEKFIYAPDEIFSLSIEYGKEVEKDSTPEEDNAPRRRFLRCPAAVTVSHLKKFVRMKYGIPQSYEIDLKYDKESLPDEYTLIDVAYVFLWRRRGPMRFFYKIVERPPKTSPKLRLVPMDDSVESTTTDAPEQPTEAAVSSPTKDAKDKTENNSDARSTPLQHVLPQSSSSSDKDVASTSADDEKPTTHDTLQPQTPEVSSEVVVAQGSHNQSPGDKVETKEQQQQQPSTTSVDESTSDSDKKESVTKSIPFRFPPVSHPNKGTGAGSGHSSSSSSSATPASEGSSSGKPAVMTVAPLTPGTTTPSHSVHNLYTIKKSPPLPPFKISAHLLSTPKVPPLKLSPPRFSKLETCLRELSSSKRSSASKKSKSSSSRGGSSSHSGDNKLELKVAQLKSSAAASSSVKCVAPLVITVPPEAKMELCRKDVACGVTSRKDVGASIVVPAPKLAAPQSEDNSKKNATTAESTTTKPDHKEQPPVPVTPPVFESSKAVEDDKMDLDDDSDLFEGPLVIAEPPDIPPASAKDNDSDNSCGGGGRPPDDTTAAAVVQLAVQPPKAEQAISSSTAAPPDERPLQPQQSPPSKPPVDSEDEEIDVVDDVDSGRGSDVSSGRTEARSLCGFDLDDLGSPDSVPPKTPEAEHRQHLPLPSPVRVTSSSPSSHPHHPFLPDPKSPPKANGVVAKGNTGDNMALDLSTCGRKRSHDEDDDEDRQRHRHHRAKQVANPAVLDKSRQTTTPCVSPRNHVQQPPFKMLATVAADLPPASHHPLAPLYVKGAGKGHHESGNRGNFKCRGNTLTVINPDPNGSRPKIVIRNLGPRPVAAERFHHHHHHHHHHHSNSAANSTNHQRM